MPQFTHIFRTKISTDESLKSLTQLLDTNPAISRWHIDMEDIDKVLKVESKKLSEQNILTWINDSNIQCETLND